MPTTLPRVEQIVDRLAEQKPDHPALIFGERCWTYAELRAEMDRRAAMLVMAGLEPGAVVASIEPVSDDLIISFLACCRADLTFFALSPRLTAVESLPLIARAKTVRMLTATNTTPAPVAQLPLCLPGNPEMAARTEAMRRASRGTSASVAALQLTSGTTGDSPKLVRTPHRTLTWRSGAPMAWGDASSVFAMALSTQFLPRSFCEALACGGTIVLIRTHDPQRIEAEMKTYHVTALLTLPTIARLLTEQQKPRPAGITLRAVRTGAAPLPPDVHRAITQRYGAMMFQSYALMEGGAMIGTPMSGAPVGSIGTPYPGVAARLINEDGEDVPDGASGELLIRTPGLMLGYLDDPEATDRTVHDGWLRTGDLARRDAEGFYFLEGRRTLRINVGGFKVAPEEVEGVLLQHPQVREVVVRAVADAARGEVVGAVIVPEGKQPSVATLRQFCRERLAAYKVPRQWEFRDELPRSPLGKVLRHQL